MDRKLFPNGLTFDDLNLKEIIYKENIYGNNSSCYRLSC